MASIPRRLLLQSRQCPSRIRTYRPAKSIVQWIRPLSTTQIRCAKADKAEGSPTAADAKDSSKAHNTQSMSKEETDAAILRDLKETLAALDPEVVQDAIRKGKHGIPFAQDINLESDEDFEIAEDDKRKAAQGFWAEGEPSMGPDEDYYGDDITSDGHKELQKHRELREYARLIAWELPLLSHLAQPFEVPTPATPFRFRYTSYLGESHPATNKVVVEFSPYDLSLTDQQATKLIKLAGPRYNPGTRFIKLSCETLSTQAQNKRFLGETITSLLAEAKDTKDTFDDVPFDFRHHKPKPRYEFPKEWVLTAERKQYLEDRRKSIAKSEDEKLNNGELVDGKRVIETSLPFLEEREPVLVSAPGGRR